jgi:hypothetical protein
MREAIIMTLLIDFPQWARLLSEFSYWSLKIALYSSTLVGPSRLESERPKKNFESDKNQWHVWHVGESKNCMVSKTYWLGY